MTKTVSKLLSRNDTGETGGHQAGILIPKNKIIQNFFPVLDSSNLNPRATINFKDDLGDFWLFSYIYYNNKYFGGTRNEFRLTGMTMYLKNFALIAGDELIFHQDDIGEYSITFSRQDIEIVNYALPQNENVLRISNTWKVIKI